jgi:hypothetical protein
LPRSFDAAGGGLQAPRQPAAAIVGIVNAIAFDKGAGRDGDVETSEGEGDRAGPADTATRTRDQGNAHRLWNLMAPLRSRSAAPYNQVTVTLTAAEADLSARSAVAAALDVDPDALQMQFKSRYCDPGGKWLPKWAASHVRTEVDLIDIDPSRLPLIERALAGLPGVMATGGFFGDVTFQSRAWVLRDIDELSANG